MKEIIFAGFGGQGVLTGGLVIADMAAHKDYETAWMPAYGPTMRGGKANCVVKYCETPGEHIGSPIMEEADVLVAMNEPALDYLEYCKPNVTVFVNEHTVRKDYPYPHGTLVVKVDCDGLAKNVGNPKGQSLVMVGAVIKELSLFDQQFARKSLLDFFDAKGKGKYSQINGDAFDAGFHAVDGESCLQREDQ